MPDFMFRRNIIKRQAETVPFLGYILLAHVISSTFPRQFIDSYKKTSLLLSTCIDSYIKHALFKTVACLSMNKPSQCLRLCQCQRCRNLSLLNLSFFLFFLSFLHFPSLHPFMPLVASCSGQRQFLWPGDSDDSDSGEERMMTSSDIRKDNGLVLWWAGPLASSSEQRHEEEHTA